MRVTILAGMLLVPLVGACGLVQQVADPGPDLNVVITDRDVLGDWHNAAVGGVLHFAANHTFQAHNLPLETFFVDRRKLPPGPALLEDHGTWRVAAPIGQERTTEVRADFAAISGVTVGAGQEIGAERQPDGLTGLVLLVYDSARFPDGRYLLTR